MITAKPDVTRKPLAGADFLIMGCDGIWEVKSNQAMVDYLTEKMKKSSLEAVTDGLLEELVASDKEAQEHGMDNMTVILVQFKP